MRSRAAKQSINCSTTFMQCLGTSRRKTVLSFSKERKARAKLRAWLNHTGPNLFQKCLGRKWKASQISKPTRLKTSKAITFRKKRCQFSNWKTERGLQCVRRERSQRLNTISLRSAARKTGNSIPPNSSKSKRKSEKNSIVFWIGCKKMLSRV